MGCGFSDPKKHSFASAGFPGFVGSFTGVNDAGLAIASHEVCAPDTATPFNPKGVPFGMAYRRVLEECATVGDAVKLLDGSERASATSLVVADTTGGAVIEVTPDALAVRRLKDKPGVCTNHLCTHKNPKQTDKFETLTRFDTLSKAVALKKDEVFGVGDVQKHLHAVRLVDARKADLTIQAFVFEPAGRKVHLRFADGNGPATAGALTAIDLNALWGKGIESVARPERPPSRTWRSRIGTASVLAPVPAPSSRVRSLRASGPRAVARSVGTAAATRSASVVGLAVARGRAYTHNPGRDQGRFTAVPPRRAVGRVAWRPPLSDQHGTGGAAVFY